MEQHLDYNHLSKVVGADTYQEAAIILPGPPLEIFAQRAAPTVVFTPLKQNTGKFYYECETATAGYMQIGWADEEFKAIAVEGKGCGDDAHSWAFDGLRCLKWHNNKNNKYGKSWNPGDVIGIAIDLNEKKIVFSLNGEDMGVAFQSCSFAGAVYPCVSLARGERLQMFFGYEADSFTFTPPNGHLPLTMSSNLNKTEEYSKFGSFANVIQMGFAEQSFSISFPGEIMVKMMGHGLDYEAKKNAMIHAGYEETLKKWQKVKAATPAIEDVGLSLNEIYSVICYTLENPPVYRFFNNDTRKGSGADGMDFPIISYLLSQACRKILAATSKEERTRIVYRGVNIPFTAKVGQIVRFGSYTSSTTSTKVADEFRRSQGTQFEIVTKIGASIKLFSAYPEEEEVLLPPYEVYRVQRLDEASATIYLSSLFDDDVVQRYIDDNKGVYEAERIAKEYLK